MNDPNRKERRTLASQARRGIQEPAKRPSRFSGVSHLAGSWLMQFYGRQFPLLSMAQHFVLNFVLGAVIGCVCFLLLTAIVLSQLEK